MAVVANIQKMHISVSSISERDVDLLLLEEFVSSIEFSNWFSKESSTGFPQFRECLSAQRSVTQSMGESDLELIFRSADGKRLLVMVENKITAGLQPKQAERYHQRGSEYVASNCCDEFRTIIVAPSAYFANEESSKGFDGRVHYESIIEWLQIESNLGLRLTYKTKVLQGAVEKSRLGYQPVEDDEATNFWMEYWKLVREHAPELRMSKPGAKAAGSTFISFKPTELPLGASIVHKLTGTKGAKSGFVDLQIPHLGNSTLELDVALEDLMEHGMSVVRVSNSAAVRLEVPMLYPNQEILPQVDLIVEGVSSAKRILEWFRKNPEIVAAIESISSKD